MKKLLSILILSITFISCNPEGTEFPEPGSIIGSYKISYIRKTTFPVTGGSYNEYEYNSDPCIAQISLTIGNDYQFTIRNFQLINNGCQETDMDYGTLDHGQSNYGNPIGSIEFSNDSSKNTNYFAQSSNGVVTNFKFNYTIYNPSSDIQKVWIEYFFIKD